MAPVLNVSRSQCSLFEIGKRDLPLASQQLLAEILVHLKEAETSGRKLPEVQRQQEKMPSVVKRLLDENAYQHELTVRKTTALQKKHTATVKALHVIEFLTKQPNKKVSNNAALQIIGKKVSLTLETSGLEELLLLELKLELLAPEKLM